MAPRYSTQMTSLRAVASSRSDVTTTTARPPRLQLKQLRVNVLDGPDSRPARGMRRDEHADVAFQLAASTTFCWLPPDRLATSCSGRCARMSYFSIISLA